jgi:hypothetical protein
MEPGTSASNPSPEMGPYKAPETPVKTGEALPVTVEQAPAYIERGEAQPQPSTHPAAAPAVAVALPTLPAPQSITASDPTTKDPAAPLVAADEDVVEKEWVDKAKKIVAQTKDDPYTQEKEVSKLQADYLKKRYGKDIKISSD